MIRISVPATSANIGSGFDSLGLALNLYNNIYMEEYDGIDIPIFKNKDYRRTKQILLIDNNATMVY